jgi:transposase-like protein
MGKTLRKYSPEFKREAVRLLVESGRPGKEVASELGIPSGRLHEWRRQ